jgi:arylsulfatase A-like enzyme
LTACGGEPAQEDPFDALQRLSPGQHNDTNVVIVLLDTVRADHLSCYGYRRSTTPFLDQLAARGVRFEHCLANASWTLPSHASLFTGVYALAHQATQETLVLGDELPTLAQILETVGYDTFGCSTNAVVNEENGLARGFSTFVETFRPSVQAGLQSPGLHVNNVALARWLRGRTPSRPFFAFLNYVEAHLPYAPIEPFASAFVDSTWPAAEVAAARRIRAKNHYLLPDGLPADQLELLSQLYDGEIAMLDQQVQRLVQMLSDTGHLQNTLLIVLSDHGENLGDRGHFGHVFDIGNSLLRVPLIVYRPDGRYAGQVREDLTQALDLFPTVLTQCGVPYEGRADGRDLFAPASSAPLAFAEYYYPRQVLSVYSPAELEANLDRLLPYMHRLRAVQDGRTKLVWASSGPSRLYDLAADPGETRDLLAEGSDPPAASRLRSALQDWMEKYRGPVPLADAPPPGWLLPGFEGDVTDPEMLEKLRALGYVD